MSETKITPYFAVGDIVRFDFTHVHEPDQRHVTGRVLGITERYTKQPLVRYSLIEGRPLAIEDRGNQYADASFIAEVIERYTGPRPPRGCFIDSGPTWVEKTQSQMVGSPHEMVLDVLHGKYLDIPRPLSTTTVWWMFQRDRPGVITEVHAGVYRVRRKSFECWVMRNWRRFIMTAAECRADARKEDEYDQEMWDLDFYDRLEREAGLGEADHSDDDLTDEGWDDFIESW